MYKESFVEVDGFKLRIYEQAGSVDNQSTPYLFAHATGFHAHCWDEVVKQLSGKRIILLDTPCHGLSDNIEPPFTWDIFSKYFNGLIEKLDLKNIYGVGHSMGGHLMVRAAGEMPERFSKVVALDPVIFSANMPRMKDLLPDDFEHPVAKRRNQWDSPEEMYEKFKIKPPFNQWHPQVIKDYCDYALIKKEEAGYELACPPRLEANIYMSTGQEGVQAAIPNIKCPVTVYRARSRTADDQPFDFGPSPTDPDLAQQIPKGTDIQLTENSHFIPMEIPHKIAEWIS